MWGRVVLATVATWAAAGWLATGGSATAQEASSFPPSLEREPLLRWLQRETDITPERVVAVTPQALTALVSTFPAGGGQGPRVVIRAEALSTDTFARTGALSWHVSLNADCKGRRVRLGETTGYPQRNLLGERKALRPAETDWRVPERGTALDNAWRAACETDFKGPFQTKDVKVTQPDGGSPAAPARTPPATPPAPAPKTPAPKAVAPAPAGAPKPPAAAARRAGGLVAQVGASPSEADARGLLVALGPRLGGREAWVETAVVGGKTWRRAMVGGFSDAAEASGFCGELKASGRACFVRTAR